MKIPYNRLHVHGGILFAARGGKIHTFDLLDGSLVSTWKHPDVDNVAEAIQAASESHKEAETEPQAAQPVEDAAEAAGDVDQSEPPAKRQKVSDAEEAKPAEDAAQPGKAGGKKSKGGKSKEEKNPSRMGNVPDRPIATQLASSADGKHIVAVTGHDKAVWVFEHNGAGHITQLSKRVMPKRPSAITISADSQIICADKFGDVYALPLIMNSSPSPTPKSAPANVPKALQRPSATVLTVHSKGNRSALLNQERQLASQEKATQGTPRSEAPEFELTLLLGHVSMLTALLLGERDGRTYILTSDRDEHIRVSRSVPQAHVIEGYCLGHRQFIGDMVIPPSDGKLLISGGGDEELYVWDWLSGKLLSKTSLLSAAKEVAPDTTNVAVSSLCTLQYQTETGTATFVLAICENISAVFTWTLVDDNTLTRPGVIQLPGKPLHIAAAPPADETGRPGIVVALHRPAASEDVKSLYTMQLTIDDGRLAVGSMASVQDEAQEAAEVEASDAEIRSLFYTVEHLRKHKGGAVAEGEEAAEGEDAADE